MTSPDPAFRVAFVSQWYAPEPVTQPVWIVDGLRGQGAVVSVLTGMPNYPSGRLQAGYRAWHVRNDVVDGVRVRRTPLYPSHDGRSSRRVLNYLSWALSSSLLGVRTVTGADVALVYSSPATAATVALLARKLSGTPYVLLIQDLWPDSIFASGFMTGRTGRLVRGTLGHLTVAYYRHASKVLVISPSMIEVLAERGVPRHKLALVYNWAPGVDFEPCQAPIPDEGLRVRLGIADDDFVLMYAGNFGAAQALHNAITGIGRLSADEGAHLVLVGAGVAQDALRALARATAPGRVHFVPAVDRYRLATLMKEADVQLVSLAADPLFCATMPSKVQGIMAAGQPILCCVDGDAARVVVESGAGLACAPDDPDAFASAVRRLRQLPKEELTGMGTRGLGYYRRHMAEGVGAQRLLAHLIEACGRGVEAPGRHS